MLRGAYHFGSYGPVGADRVTLLGSGAILTEVVKAAEQLALQGMGSDVFSVTSWSELARDGAASERAYIAELLDGSKGPIVAATDYVRAVPESVRAYLPVASRYVTLGTDGFGRSDTRAALRSYFHVDAASIAASAIESVNRSAIGKAA